MIKPTHIRLASQTTLPLNFVFQIPPPPVEVDLRDYRGLENKIKHHEADKAERSLKEWNHKIALQRAQNWKRVTLPEEVEFNKEFTIKKSIGIKFPKDTSPASMKAFFLMNSTEAEAEPKVITNRGIIKPVIEYSESDENDFWEELSKEKISSMNCEELAVELGIEKDLKDFVKEIGGKVKLASRKKKVVVKKQ